jgi:hypothetical protein
MWVEANGTEATSFRDVSLQHREARKDRSGVGRPSDVFTCHEFKTTQARRELCLGPIQVIEFVYTDDGAR